MRRLLALSLLVLALGALVAPAAIAAVAILRGDLDAALDAVRPLLLIPCVFVLAGVWFSVRRVGASPPRRPPDVP